jgi:hypothetical protein
MTFEKTLEELLHEQIRKMMGEDRLAARKAAQAKCKHDYRGDGWERLVCTKCGKKTTQKRLNAANKAAAASKYFRQKKQLDQN